ncbi:unnamed protein product [Didymodactylos carnosus]|uniref:Uncharacterized protein n=1 Tax=Didymodactylos carnosus TaxID=1234261 RepID=A0A8S2EXG4_9BILA|nr:unnamed protein product [Didymodactylos carnosus]CAF4072106.1 unnamed protein product [Didymodactylos carnosus]
MFCWNLTCSAGILLALNRETILPDRRADLRFYGLPEQDGEDTCQLIIQTCASIGVLQSIGDQIDQLLDD